MNIAMTVMLLKIGKVAFTSFEVNQFIIYNLYKRRHLQGGIKNVRIDEDIQKF